MQRTSFGLRDNPYGHRYVQPRSLKLNKKNKLLTQTKNSGLDRVIHELQTLRWETALLNPNENWFRERIHFLAHDVNGNKDFQLELHWRNRPQLTTISEWLLALVVEDLIKLASKLMVLETVQMEFAGDPLQWSILLKWNYHSMDPLIAEQLMHPEGRIVQLCKKVPSEISTIQKESTFTIQLKGTAANV